MNSVRGGASDRGQIKIVLYPGETMTKSAQILDGVIKGISDFGFCVNGYNPGRLPLMDVTDLPIRWRPQKK